MTNSYFPFHALGFKSNPFRALTDAEWAEIAVLPDAVLSVLAGGFAHLQVLGDLGCGKTTTLLGLTRRFRDEGRRVAYEYLLEGQMEFRTALDGLDIFLLDEVQRLSRRERGRLVAQARRAALVLGSHEDMRPLFANNGLELTTVQLKEAATPDHLKSALERRLSFFALDSNAPGVTFPPDAVSYLIDSFGGNLRAAQNFLYEVFQRLKAKGAITANYLRAEAGVIGVPGPK